MKFLRLSFFLCLAALFSFYSVTAEAQSLQQLDKSYQEKSQKLLDQFILKHQIASMMNPDNDTVRQLSAVINLLINHYCADTSSGHVPNAPSMPGYEEYVILQPIVEACFVDTLELAEILKPNSERRPGLNAAYMFPHQNVYRPFLSDNYYEFPDLLKCKKWNYIINNRGKGRFKVLRADTNLVYIVNNFLGKKGVENFNKSNFLRKEIKTYRSHESQYISSINKRVRIYYFNYAMYIDKIVFNKSMNHALVQFSFVNQSLEALYVKLGNRWILRHYGMTMQL